MMNRDIEIISRPARGRCRGAIVFAHGICHGAWCWEKFLGYFSERGYDCYAVSYRGHGRSNGRARIDHFNMDDYVADLRMAVDVCTEKSGCKPVVVGHSMGGGVVQRYIGKYEGTVKGAVLFASATAGGLPASICCDMLVKPTMRTTFGIVLGLHPSTDALCSSAFFGGRLNAGEVGTYKPLMQRESLRVMMSDMLRPFTDNYNVGIPVLVLGTDTDAFFPTSSQRITAAHYNVQPVILNGLCHDMMLDPEWERAANEVFVFAERID